MKKNRNVVAFAGVMFHLMIGSVYAWSIFSKPIIAQTHWSEASVSFTFSLAIFCLGMSAASPMAQSMTGMSVAKAVVMVGIIGLFNGFGRLVWATLSDYIGRPNTFSLIFIVDILMLVLMLIFKLPFVFTIAFCLLLSCYGAGFSVIPAYLGDVFGTKELGAIHGYVLTAWAVAGMIGPVLLSVTHELLHTYTVTIIAFIIIDVIALFFSYHIRKDFVREIRNLKQEA